MGLEAIVKGWTGELKTKFINFLFLDGQYRVFNNIIIETGHGSTQIDHVIVSQYGIFVIETKDKTGWIFGDPHAEKWTQVLHRKNYQFQNPLRQNYGHTKILSGFLGVEHGKIHSLVIFWGDCEFKTPMPDNVLKGGIFNGEYKNFVRSKTATPFSPEEFDRICSYLAKAKDSSGFMASWHHAREVQDRYASKTTCPKCGSDMVERVASRGPGSGNPFLGCTNYPRCRYTKEL